MRKSTYSMMQVDERILEYLSAEEWSTPDIMANTRGFEATVNQIHERCLVLAHAELVAPVVKDSDMWELTKWGALYLEGKIDAAHQEWPYSVRAFVENLS